MRILGSAVITFEAFVMGFALLLAMDSHGTTALIIGGLICLLSLMTAGLMKSKKGWYLGTALQVAIIGYGIVVPVMYFMGALFAGLWGAAFFFGRKGEAIRAQLIAEREKTQDPE